MILQPGGRPEERSAFDINMRSQLQQKKGTELHWSLGGQICDIISLCDRSDVSNASLHLIVVLQGHISKTLAEVFFLQVFTPFTIDLTIYGAKIDLI